MLVWCTILCYCVVLVVYHDVLCVGMLYTEIQHTLTNYVNVHLSMRDYLCFTGTHHGAVAHNTVITYMKVHLSI